MTPAERAKALSHDDSCDGIFRPPVLPDSELWICDVCSFAVDAGPNPIATFAAAINAQGPAFEAPFALSAEVSTRKGKQGGLF